MTDEFTIQGEKFYAHWLPNRFCNLRLHLDAEELQQPAIPPYQGPLRQLTPEQVNEFLRQMEMFNQNLRVAAETVVREQAQIQQARQALEQVQTTGLPDLRGVCPRLDQCHDLNCHLAHPIPYRPDENVATRRKKSADNARLQALIQSLEDEKE